jgi:cobalamin biosynthesis Mg chelatase CobN
VKPSNSTRKNTTCWTGGSSSSPTCQPGPNADSSKRYGNGTTAAQIAVSRGAPANTEIYGPGNSQPHKVCKKVNKNGKEVWADVHAVKSYVGVCVTTSTSQSPVTSTSTSTSSTSSAGVTASTSQTGSTSGTAGTTGVAGVAVESGSPQSGAGGGVLGAFGVAGVAAGGVLPFTGFPIWLAILIAIGLIAIGWTLYRRGRPATGDLV